MRIRISVICGVQVHVSLPFEKWARLLETDCFEIDAETMIVTIKDTEGGGKLLVDRGLTTGMKLVACMGHSVLTMDEVNAVKQGFRPDLSEPDPMGGLSGANGQPSDPFLKAFWADRNYTPFGEQEMECEYTFKVGFPWTALAFGFLTVDLPS